MTVGDSEEGHHVGVTVTRVILLSRTGSAFLRSGLLQKARILSSKIPLSTCDGSGDVVPALHGDVQREIFFLSDHRGKLSMEKPCIGQEDESDTTILPECQ